MADGTDSVARGKCLHRIEDYARSTVLDDIDAAADKIVRSTPHGVGLASFLQGEHEELMVRTVGQQPDPALRDVHRDHRARRFRGDEWRGVPEDRQEVRQDYGLGLPPEVSVSHVPRHGAPFREPLVSTRTPPMHWVQET